VQLDGLKQIIGAAIMQEENTLADPREEWYGTGPDQRRPEYALVQRRAHVVHQQVGEQLDRTIHQNRLWKSLRSPRWYRWFA